MTIEHIVRPFQTDVLTPPSQSPEAQAVRRKNVTLNVGAAGSVKTFSGAYNLSVTYYAINKPKEKTTT